VLRADVRDVVGEKRKTDGRRASCRQNSVLVLRNGKYNDALHMRTEPIRTMKSLSTQGDMRFYYRDLAHDRRGPLRRACLEILSYEMMIGHHGFAWGRLRTVYPPAPNG
jgi:hypothetical protein